MPACKASSPILRTNSNPTRDAANQSRDREGAIPTTQHIGVQALRETAMPGCHLDPAHGLLCAYLCDLCNSALKPLSPVGRF